MPRFSIAAARSLDDAGWGPAAGVKRASAFAREQAVQRSSSAAAHEKVCARIYYALSKISPRPQSLPPRFPYTHIPTMRVCSVPLALLRLRNSACMWVCNMHTHICMWVCNFTPTMHTCTPIHTLLRGRRRFATAVRPRTPPPLRHAARPHRLASRPPTEGRRKRVGDGAQGLGPSTRIAA